MKDIKKLLELVKLIDEKYKPQHRKSNFNIFTILRNESDEVNLHSKFIVELLSNIDNYSKTFLKLFIKNIGLGEEWFAGENVRVLKEYKNVDILIRSNDKDIIIENKIYAGDQYKQLERYYTEVSNKNENLKMYYLTLDGHEPSEQSLGETLCSENEVEDGKPMVMNLSYGNHISLWIQDCIKEVALVPEIRETLVQYLQVVDKLSGNTESKELKGEIASFLVNSEENLLLAKKLQSGYVEAVFQLKMKFWQELEEEIKKDSYLRDYPIRDYDKYSDGNIRNRNRKYYGVLYPIKELEEGYEIVLRFEVYSRFYWGFAVLKNKKNNGDCKTEKFRNLRGVIQEKIKSKINSKVRIDDGWLAYMYPSESMNYKDGNEEFLALGDKVNRKEFISNLVKVASKITEDILRESEKLKIRSDNG